MAIASGCTNATLSFCLHVDTSESTTTTAFDTLTAQILNPSGTVLGTLGTFSNRNAASGYTLRTFDLSPYAGQTIAIQFTGTEGSTFQTSFVIEDTSLAVKQHAGLHLATRVRFGAGSLRSGSRSGSPAWTAPRPGAIPFDKQNRFREGFRRVIMTRCGTRAQLLWPAVRWTPSIHAWMIISTPSWSTANVT